MEGIFRLAGSEKRIKELKVAFDSPDRYGKGLDWTGYTVHDAANILRRYFNQLPEPIIPLSFYNRFRDPLRNHQAQAVGAIEAQSPSVGDFDQDAAILEYQKLITELPPLNRQLLLYILDLLAVFASKSDLNKMTTPNLAAIFQPGILSHPQHDMAPPEYRLSQDVLIFLIENQDSFLLGMPGTGADPETVREVQNAAAAPPYTPTTPTRSKTIVGRSSSNASVGADSVRKFGNIRRNVSVSSSKHSKRSEAGPTPVTGGMNSPTTSSSGVHRSNTVPSRRGNSNAASPRFSRENKSSDPPTPNAATPTVGADVSKPRQESLQSTPIATSAPQFPAATEAVTPTSEVTTPLAPVSSENSSALAREYQTPKKDTTPLLAPPGSADQNADRSLSTPTTSGRGFLDIFKQSPPSDVDARKPNKLQKKRIPGSSISSAQSSSQSLQNDSPASATRPNAGHGFTELTDEKTVDQSTYAAAQSTPMATQGNLATPRGTGDNTLRPTVSPTHSFNSTTDMSDADMVGDDMPKDQASAPEKGKRRHRSWFSRSQNKLEQPSPQVQQEPSPNPLGTMTAKEQTTSRSTVGSTGNSYQPRRSFQDPAPLMPAATDPSVGSPIQSAGMIQPSSTDPTVFSDSEKEKKGPMSWIRGKMKERKDNKEDERRSKTPDRGRDPRESKGDLQVPNESLPVRGKSFEQQRNPSLPVNPPSNQSGSNPQALAAAQQAAVNTSAVPSTTTTAASSPDSAASAQAQVQTQAPAPSPVVPLATNGTGLQHGGEGTTVLNQETKP